MKMSRDDIWKKLKEEKQTVYGEPMLDVFLKTTDFIENKHLRELPPSKRQLVAPNVRLMQAYNAEEAEEAVKDGADNIINSFAYAARTGKNEIVRWAISRKNHSRYWLDLILKTAIRNGHEDAARIIVDAGAEYEFDEEHGSSLAAAVREGHWGVVEYIIDTFKVGREKRMREEMREIMRAAAKGGNVIAVKKMIEMGADNFEDAYEAAMTSSSPHKQTILSMLKLRIDWDEGHS
jgi:hypothetical protein